MPSMLLKPTCLESSRGSHRLGRAVLWVMSHPFWNGIIYSMLGFGSHALIDGPIAIQTFFSVDIGQQLDDALIRSKFR